MPYYVIHMDRGEEESASASPSSIEAVIRLDEAQREGWTPATILRDDRAICEEELRDDALHERWLD